MFNIFEWPASSWARPTNLFRRIDYSTTAFVILAAMSGIAAAAAFLVIAFF
jgi:hypothetical protein